MHNNPYFFVTAGDRHLRLWSILREEKKLYVQDVLMASKTRVFYCARIDKTDEFAYLGTGTGDIVKIVLNCCDRDHVSKQGSWSNFCSNHRSSDSRDLWSVGILLGSPRNPLPSLPRRKPIPQMGAISPRSKSPSPRGLETPPMKSIFVSFVCSGQVEFPVIAVHY